jgi:transposase
MLSLSARLRIFAAAGAVDFRKGLDGLAPIVRDGFGEDPFGGDVFAFFNRRRDLVKLLVWDHNGIWLPYKRARAAQRHRGAEGVGARARSADC